LRRARPVTGAAERIRLRAHQRLGEALDHLAQQIWACLLELLAQPAEYVQGELDHRAPPPIDVGDDGREDDARWSAIAGPAEPPPPSRPPQRGAARRV